MAAGFRVKFAIHFSETDGSVEMSRARLLWLLLPVSSFDVPRVPARRASRLRGAAFDELLAAESLQRAALLTSTEGDWAGYLQRYAVAARCYAADDEAPGALPRAIRVTERCDAGDDDGARRAPRLTRALAEHDAPDAAAFDAIARASAAVAVQGGTPHEPELFAEARGGGGARARLVPSPATTDLDAADVRVFFAERAALVDARVKPCLCGRMPDGSYGSAAAAAVGAAGDFAFVSTVTTFALAPRPTPAAWLIDERAGVARAALARRVRVEFRFDPKVGDIADGSVALSAERQLRRGRASPEFDPWGRKLSVLDAAAGLGGTAPEGLRAASGARAARAVTAMAAGTSELWLGDVARIEYGPLDSTATTGLDGDGGGSFVEVSLMPVGDAADEGVCTVRREFDPIGTLVRATCERTRGAG